MHCCTCWPGPESVLSFSYFTCLHCGCMFTALSCSRWHWRYRNIICMKSPSLFKNSVLTYLEQQVMVSTHLCLCRQLLLNLFLQSLQLLCCFCCLCSCSCGLCFLVVNISTHPSRGWLQLGGLSLRLKTSDGWEHGCDILVTTFVLDEDESGGLILLWAWDYLHKGFPAETDTSLTQILCLLLFAQHSHVADTMCGFNSLSDWPTSVIQIVAKTTAS